VEPLDKGVMIIGWDGKSPDGWGNVVNQIDAVVNLAGTPLDGDGIFDIWLTEKRKKSIITSREDTTNALIQAIQEAEEKPDVYVQASAVGYYGFSEEEIIDESAPPGEDFFSVVQQRHEENTEILESMGIRRVLIRTGLVLDKDEGSLQYFLLQFRLFAGGRLGSGDQYYSWIHIKDEAAAIRKLLEDERAVGPFNLTAPNPEKNKDFAKILGKVMRRPSFFVVPAFLLKLVLGEVAAIVLQGQRVVPKKLQDLGYDFQYPVLEEALRNVLT
jgi:uncharacterized protein (TIGR01777 family)